MTPRPSSLPDAVLQSTIDDIYRREGRRIFATLVRLLGSFDLAEEALQDAFRAAMEHWPQTGVPENARAWLISAGRFRTIDGLRRRARFVALDDVGDIVDAIAADEGAVGETELLEDDRLRLIFTCCHPALAAEARVALTLREVCGLSTEEIARAFLIPAPTLAQRIVRAKAKIRDARIPYQVPEGDQLPARLDAVLRVIYLVFNEAYSASSGPDLVRPDLSHEAIRLNRLLIQLLPEPEVMGLLALMLLHESRREARSSPRGELIPLEEQDRSRWDVELMHEGRALVREALSSPRLGVYALQAAIAAVHADAATPAATDWAQIVGLYDALLQEHPSPVVALNRAVAMAMRDGPAAGLPLVESLIAQGGLDSYHLAYAARADLCRRLGRHDDARVAYLAALALTRQEPEQRFLRRRLAELDT